MCCARVTTRWWPFTPGVDGSSEPGAAWLSVSGCRCGRRAASALSFPGPAGVAGQGGEGAVGDPTL